ncbi:MAG: hypothetical protein VB131_01515 [Burkholderia gladioli]
MESRVFDTIPEFGIVQYWHYDPASDTATIESVQDHAAIVETNRRAFNATDERARYHDGMHHVARIPLVVLQDLMAKGITKDPKAMKKWLNDPENRYFRVRPGRV